jgi:hypothetical protein
MTFSRLSMAIIIGDRLSVPALSLLCWRLGVPRLSVGGDPACVARSYCIEVVKVLKMMISQKERRTITEHIVVDQIFGT